MENSIVNNIDYVDNIDKVCYNRGIINERITMKLKDEIKKIEEQSRQIKEIREDINEIFKGLK